MSFEIDSLAHQPERRQQNSISCMTRAESRAARDYQRCSECRDHYAYLRLAGKVDARATECHANSAFECADMLNIIKGRSMKFVRR